MSHFTETGFWRVAKPIESEQSSFSAATVRTPSINTGVQALRNELVQLNAWPEAGDTFLELLAKAQGYGVTLVPSDFEWLPKVVDSVYNGEDIGQRYPSIFQKLLTYPDLREKFLQSLYIRRMAV